jgi:hypothetical protein
MITGTERAELRSPTLAGTPRYFTRVSAFHAACFFRAAKIRLVGEALLECPA